MSLERVTFSFDGIYIYQIPPLRSLKEGYNSSQWDLNNPLWQGGIRVVEVDNDNGDVECVIRLQDTKTGELFAEAPYSAAGKGVDSVNGSSRLFAITVVDSGRRAVLGLGFPDRSASFEFNIALQDFKKHAAPLDTTLSSKDYELKEGEQIHVRFPGASETSGESEATASSKDGETQDIPALLPPPPSGRRTRAPPAAPAPSGFDDDFGDFSQAV